LHRAIEKIRDEPGWDFNLQELASHSGVSERNLYYLMKRETGMTPYRLYQRNRLMRVRQRLVDCQCDVPHISWYAADAGFSHLGRFAALYREHFGELPSETVQWRRNLQGRGVDQQALEEPDLLLS
jgi:transcriptional regulator GlxA family with amidase domain